MNTFLIFANVTTTFYLQNSFFSPYKTETLFSLNTKSEFSLPCPCIHHPIFCLYDFKIIHWCFPTVMLEKTLECPLDCIEDKPVHLKGNQLWIFIGRTDAETEAPILWPPDANSQLIGKDLDAGKDWGQEEKWVTEDEIVGSHHWLNGPEFEQIRGDSEGQVSLVCHCSWDRKESDTT